MRHTVINADIILVSELDKLITQVEYSKVIKMKEYMDNIELDSIEEFSEDEKERINIKVLEMEEHFKKIITKVFPK